MPAVVQYDDRMTPDHGFAIDDRDSRPRPLYLVHRDGLPAWRDRQPRATTQWLL